MADLQGICTFPTLNRITSATFTLSHGITPSSAIVTVDYQATRPAAGGTLSFQFGRTRINFPGCRIDNARGTYSRGRRIQFRILDRRWKWHPDNGGGSISGKHDDKKPQELARMLLNAMGESGYDVSQLPNGGNMEVDWNYANPAQALSTLCNSLGCRIVLHLNNRVKIHRQGVGARLSTAGALTHSYGINPPERPDDLLLIGGPTLFQSRLRLEAIGQQPDNGKFVPLEHLDYTPRKGWSEEDPDGFYGVEEKHLELALRDVFRLYRVVSQANGGQKVPGYGKVKEIEQLFPLRDTLVALPLDPVPLPAYALGEFMHIPDGLLDYEPTDTLTVWPGEISIDGPLGHVRFSGPVFKHEEFLGTVPADAMFLVCSYSVTESRTNQKKRHTHKRNLPGRRLGTGSRIVHRDGVVREVRAVYGEQGTPEENKVESIADTEPEFHRRANFHLAAIAEQYRNVETNDVTYAGILAIDLDGAVQQVTWKVGGGPATTQASTNIEHNFAVPSYATRQLRETISLIALRPAPKTKP